MPEDYTSVQVNDTTKRRREPNNDVVVRNHNKTKMNKNGSGKVKNNQNPNLRVNMKLQKKAGVFLRNIWKWDIKYLELKKKMTDYAEDLDFEQAAKIRDEIKILENSELELPAQGKMGYKKKRKKRRIIRWL